MKNHFTAKAARYWITITELISLAWTLTLVSVILIKLDGLMKT